MRKKVYSVLLAACLFIGLALPAFALEFGDSAEAGDPSEITQLVFNKTSYTVKNGEELELANELTAYCGSSKVCLYTDYVWSATDSLSLGVDPATGVVGAYENSGSITVTVTEQNSGKKATVKVTAAKSDALSTAEATGFKFEKTAYTFYTGNIGDEQTIVRVIPTPAGRVFSTAQKEFLEREIPLAFFNADVASLDVIAASDSADRNNLLFQPTGVLSESQISARATKVSMNNMNFPNPTNPSKPFVTSKTVNAKIEKGVPARNLIKKGSIKIQVGQTVDLNQYLQFPSSANYGMKCTFELTYANDSAVSFDYAVLGDDMHTIKGVAVGSLKAIATLPDGSASTEIPIQVVARSSSGSSEGTNPTGASITPTIGTVKVGASLTLTAKNVPAGGEVSWFLDDDSKATLVENGATATVTGVTTGTVKVLAYVDSTEIGTATLTITAAGTSNGGSTTNPIVPPSTSNPQTGDSWFAGLF